MLFDEFKLFHTMLALVIVIILISLFFIPEKAYPKELFKIEALGEKLTVETRLDNSTKLHFIRDFTFSTAVLLLTKKQKEARIFSYSFMVAYELGQERLGLIDVAVGIIGIELNHLIMRKLLGAKLNGKIRFGFRKQQNNPSSTL